MAAVTLRLGTTGDLGFVCALVRRPENAAYLTDEDETALATYLDSPAARLLIWGDSNARGFAIFCCLDSAAGSVCLMRLCLDAPGQGEGAGFLRALVDYGFGTLHARRLWLDTAGENLRAQKAYARAGFVLEGRLRQHEYVPRVGRVIDTLFYGILRSEWEALDPLRSGA